MQKQILIVRLGRSEIHLSKKIQLYTIILLKMLVWKECILVVQNTQGK